jgi:hypothetical protein
LPIAAVCSGESRIVDQDGDLDSVGGLEFYQQPRDVGFHGCDAHEQLRTDLRVGLARSDRNGDFAFPITQSGEQQLRPGAPLVRRSAGHGRVARTTKSPSSVAPCVSSPPPSPTRSASPSRPVPALVIYFVLPTVWSILVQSFNFLHMLEQWLDLGTTSEPLYNFAMTGSAWLHLGSSVGVWLLLPLGAGIVRLLHQEVK